MVYNKYKNKKIEQDDIKFDSEMEYKFYKALIEYINDFKRCKYSFEWGMRKEFELQPKFKYKGKTVLPIKYVSDFNIGKYIIDIKGMKTVDFKLKEKMFKYTYGQQYELVCICPCPKKYLDKIDKEYIWEQLGFIELDKLKKLRKESKKTDD